MRFIHTADWHIGHTLYGKRRYGETALFLNWLIETMDEQGTELLLVAGDIFDSPNPSTQARRLYYQFLGRVCKTGCKHVVITGGNHDSPGVLNAPRDIMAFLDIHVVGCMEGNLHDEVLVLNNADDEPAVIVCAVPFLRDCDIRTAVPGESLEEKAANVVNGIRGHYTDVCEAAVVRRDKLGANIPILAMGHLFAEGGTTRDGDGVRERTVGQLGRVKADCFPDCIGYLALGHLHQAQLVADRENLRYSGSPLAMSFGECDQQKAVLGGLIDGEEIHSFELLPVPVFQRLAAVSGSLDDIEKRLAELATEADDYWLDIDCDAEVVPNLREWVEQQLDGTQLEALRIRNSSRVAPTLTARAEVETLSEMSPEQVFEDCLGHFRVSDEQRTDLVAGYSEILAAIRQEETPEDEVPAAAPNEPTPQLELGFDVGDA